MSFADFIKSVLSERGWTQDHLANSANIPQSTVNAFVARGTRPVVENLRRIHEATGISMRRLLIEAEYLEPGDFRAPRISDDEETLLLWYRRIPVNRRPLILNMLEAGVRSLTDQDGKKPSLPGDLSDSSSDFGAA